MREDSPTSLDGRSGCPCHKCGTSWCIGVVILCHRGQHVGMPRRYVDAVIPCDEVKKSSQGTTSQTCWFQPENTLSKDTTRCQRHFSSSTSVAQGCARRVVLPLFFRGFAFGRFLAVVWPHKCDDRNHLLGKPGMRRNGIKEFLRHSQPDSTTGLAGS